VVSAASVSACGGRGSALLLQQGVWAGELLEGLCNRGFVLVVTFFCRFDGGRGGVGGVVWWKGDEQDKLSFGEFGHKSREVGEDWKKFPDARCQDRH